MSFLNVIYNYLMSNYKTSDKVLKTQAPFSTTFHLKATVKRKMTFFNKLQIDSNNFKMISWWVVHGASRVFFTFTREPNRILEIGMIDKSHTMRVGDQYQTTLPSLVFVRVIRSSLNSRPVCLSVQVSATHVSSSIILPNI